MNELARPVGLGLAARGSVEDTVEWAHEARRQGLESVWFHDSYFERDAVTYGAALASQVPDIRIGLGALNPNTRHPVLVAMTVSAMDEMAPGRVLLGMGTGLPLRLHQMGIPYTPEGGVEGVSEAMDIMRELWAGERIPSAREGFPPIQPMFPPVHHVPIYIAASRSAFLELAGQKADGYLARPAESVPNLRRITEKIRTASVEAGRPEDAVHMAGYLLTLIDDTRREALNRAKREPFVIYMMSVLSNTALKRAGFEIELRDRIREAWRAEEYHQAAQLIPDELLDAFILCGTREDVAAGAERYVAAGLDLPILQPVVQDTDQVDAIFDAAVVYGRQAPAPAGQPVGSGTMPVAGRMSDGTHDEVAPAGSRLADDHTLGAGTRVRRRLAAWYELVRPFSFTASTVPVAAGGALAAVHGLFDWPLFLAALIGAVLLHMGTNVVNEIYDVRQGIDTITSPRASHAILKGRVSEREAFLVAGSAFALASIIGLGLIAVRGWPIAALGALGLIGGFGYTAPPLQYKYRALGIPLVFALMGPLMTVGAYYAVTGAFSLQALVVSVPVGFLVAGILQGNEWRDISEDARVGVATLSIRYGRRAAHLGYVSLVVGAYLLLTVAVLLRALPVTTLMAILSLPLLVRVIRASELGATGQRRAIAMIDLETARLHAAFGYLLVLGLVLAWALQ